MNICKECAYFAPDKNEEHFGLCEHVEAKVHECGHCGRFVQQPKGEKFIEGRIVYEVKDYGNYCVVGSEAEHVSEDGIAVVIADIVCNFYHMCKSKGMTEESIVDYIGMIMARGIRKGWETDAPEFKKEKRCIL